MDINFLCFRRSHKHSSNLFLYTCQCCLRLHHSLTYETTLQQAQGKLLEIKYAQKQLKDHFLAARLDRHPYRQGILEAQEAMSGNAICNRRVESRSLTNNAASHYAEE